MKCLNKNCEQLTAEDSNYCSQHALLPNQVLKYEMHVPTSQNIEPEANFSCLPYQPPPADYKKAGTNGRKIFYLVIPAIVLTVIVLIVWFIKFR